MKSAVWILVSLLFTGHPIEGYSVQYDGDHETGRHVPQARTTRYVDSSSGSWNTNIGYTSTKGKEGGVLGGLLDTVSSISSGVAEKGQGSDQVNAKGSLQIKVDADAAGVTPTRILGSVVANAASAIGSLSDLANKNIKSRRNFGGSFVVEGTSYSGANGHHFTDQDQIIGTNGHDAATSTKVVTSQSQSASNSEAVNVFKSEGRRKGSRLTEHLSGNLGIHREIEKGQDKGTHQQEVIISTLPIGSTATTSTFGGSRIASSNFESQFSRSEDGSYSIYPNDYVTISEIGRDYFSESEASQPHVLIAEIPADQFSRTLSANVGPSGLTSSSEENVGVTTHGQEDATNIQNVKTTLQTSSLKDYTSSYGKLHENSHVDDYEDSDENIDIENYSTISQKEAAQTAANGQLDVKTAGENTDLKNQYSEIGHTTDYDSSSNSEETDSTYYIFTKNTGQAGSVQNIPHSTLLDFTPDSDYIDSDESEKVEGNVSGVIPTLSVSSQVNQARPTIEIQREITGDYFHNLDIASSDLQNKEKLSGTGTKVSIEDISEHKIGHPSYLLQEDLPQKLASNERISYSKRNEDSSEIEKHGLIEVETGASSKSFRKHSDNSGLVERDEYEYTSGLANNQAVLLGKTLVSTESDTSDREAKGHEHSQFHVGQVFREANNQNYAENKGTTNGRLLKEGREFITNSQSPVTFETEAIESSDGQHFKSRGEVAHSALGNSEHGSETHQFRFNAYPIVDDRHQNLRPLSNSGRESDYFNVHPGTKIVRKEITETVHTSRGPPHEFEHSHIHRTPLRRNFNERDFGSIRQSDSSGFLSTDRQLHELHHGHGHGRFEGRLLNRRSQQGFLGSFNSPHNIEGDAGGLGTQGHILGEIHSHGEGKQFHQLHSTPISYPGDGHEGGRIGFRKIVKVTHEIEDVPRHGREIEFGHGHYYH